ncbi:MAG: hypothetical protein ABS46_11730 [Cytophagaceae bacterium SCN 52-12]|nr:MAG: hypothetical protein ABS46_11730 [Cytophagaceae bacterium SCN 52-12]
MKISSFAPEIKNDGKMAVTRLKRKGLRNKLNAKSRVDRIKDLLRKPDIRNVDVEAIKASFTAKAEA